VSGSISEKISTVKTMIVNAEASRMLDDFETMLSSYREAMMMNNDIVKEKETSSLNQIIMMSELKKLNVEKDDFLF
jgi:hypothetical protein